ncbi:MAG: gluconate 2-dehydrogenase subunit 3 family protein [bacterium]
MNDASLSRRRLLQVGLYGGAVLVIPLAPLGCGDGEEGQDGNGAGDGTIPSPDDGRFFDAHQYETVRAATGLIIPEDEDPGAVAAGVVDYIDYLLGAFRVDPPRIYAAGPFSGRHGGENGFSVYLPLSRVREIAWRNTIEGSRGIPEREFNGPVVGLQEVYTRGVERLDDLARTFFQADFRDLGAVEQKAVWDSADTAFRETLHAHTVEGMYAAPEYGGNAGLAGWNYIQYEGDRQPIGYTREQVEEADEGTYGAAVLSPEEIEEAAELLRAIAGLSKRPG